MSSEPELPKRFEGFERSAPPSSQPKHVGRSLFCSLCGRGRRHTDRFERSLDTNVAMIAQARSGAKRQCESRSPSLRAGRALAPDASTPDAERSVNQTWPFEKN